MRRLAASILVFLASWPALAENPSTAKGFQPGHLYQFGELSHVNLFNGNLNLALPIGQGYPVGGNLSYGPTLAYAGNSWSLSLRSQELCETIDGNQENCRWVTVYHYIPTISGVSPAPGNAGIGWYFSSGGQLAGSQESPAPARLYRTADGAQYDFGVDQAVSESGDTFMRLKAVACGDNSACHDVEFPDGTIHRFKDSDGVPLVGIRDRFGNNVSVAITPPSSGPGLPPTPQIWQFTDSAGRIQTVSFERLAAPTLENSGDEPKFFDVVKTVQLTAFGGGTTTYTFHYSPDANNIDHVTLIARPLITACACNDLQINSSVYVPLLTSLTLPDGSSYSMTYHNGSDTDRSFSGSIRGLTLPTLGKYEWTYQMYTFPGPIVAPGPPGGDLNLPDTVNYAIGLMDEIKRDASGTPLSQTHYDTKWNSVASDNATTLVNTVRLFAGTMQGTLLSRSVHYFGLRKIVGAPFPTNTLTFPDLLHVNYGLPITTDVAAIADPDAPANEGISNPEVSGGKTRYLSSKTYDGTGNLLSYSYLSYGVSTFTDSEKVFYRNPLDGSLTSSTTDSTDFDGYGHYRMVTTSGTGFSGTTLPRTVTTNYNKPDADTGGNIFDTGTFGTANARRIAGDSPWLINMYTSMTASDGTFSRKSLFSFNTGTGFLERTRTMAGLTPAAHDLVTVATPDGTGDVQMEEHFGGDVTTLPTGPLASTNFSNRTYALQHQYSAGVPSKAFYIDPTCAALPQTSCPSILDVLDSTIDTGTGFTAISRDTSGLATVYGYDASGRLTSVAPPGVAPTTYTYTNASSSLTPASVTVETPISGTTNGLKSIYTYDGLGRIVLDMTIANDASRCRSTSYDAAGRVASVSSLGTCPSPGHFTTSLYDALNRVISVTEPDGSVTSFDRSAEPATTKRTMSVHTLQGETLATTIEKHDRWNRLSSLQEPNGTVTSYTYDVADHLISVAMPGEGTVQHRFFTYDGRGFLLSEQHPELGITGDGSTSYDSYDARGHAGHKITGASSGTYDLLFTYDSSERLRTISDFGGNHLLKEFTFAGANGTNPMDYRAGKLLTAVRHNKMPSPFTSDTVITETYKYTTPSGRLSQLDTEVKNGSNTIQSFSQPFSYDNLGAITAPGYPTCVTPVTCAVPGLTTATNVYTNSMLTSVQGFGTLSYNSNGTLGTITHAGNTGVTVVDTITPDTTGLPRPKSIDYSGWAPQTCFGPSTPSITAQSSQLPPGNQGTTLTATATGCGGALTYQWYSGTSGNITTSLGTGATHATGALQATASFWVRVTDAVTNATADSITQTITVCSSPVITTQPQSTTVAVNQSATLSVAAIGCGTLSYQWYSGTSGNTSSGVLGTAASYVTGALATTTSFWVKVTDSVGSAPVSSSTAPVTVGCTPQITEQPADQAVDFGTQVSVHVTVTGCTGKGYVWYSGQSGDETNPLGGGAFHTASINGQFDHGPIWVQISGQGITTVNSNTAMISVRPVSVNAHVTSGTSISITWAGHANRYLVRRCANGICGNLASSPTSLSTTDTGAVNTAYAYSVASVDAFGNASAFSAQDLATTITFTPVQQNGVVSRTHINELLTAVNLVRAATVPSSPPVTWSGILPAGVPPPPADGQPTVPIYAAHITSLRTQMNLALTALGIPTPAYTDALTNGTPIKAIHFTEIQDRTR